MVAGSEGLRPACGTQFVEPVRIRRVAEHHHLFDAARASFTAAQATRIAPERTSKRPA